MSLRAFVKIFINTLIGVGLVFLWLQFVDIQKIIAELKTVDLGFVWPAFVAIFLAVWIRSLKLKIFLSPVKRVALKDVVFLNGAAMLFNFLIPIRAGEVLKGIYLGSNYGFPLTKAVVWIFLDRFLDFLTVLILAAVLLLIIPTSLSINFIMVITVIFLVVICLSFLMIFKPKVVLKIYASLEFLLIFKMVKRVIRGVLDHLIESFAILKRPAKDLLVLFGLSALGYLGDALIFYFLSLSIGHPLSLIKSYLAQLMSALTYLIPAGPGYVGSAEASGLLIFSGVFGMEPNLASALTVLFHMVMAIWIIGFGILSVYFLKIEPAEIFRKIFRKAD